MATLRRESRGRSGPLTKSGQWRGFATKSPGKGHRTKEVAFKSFPAIIEAIVQAATHQTGGFEPCQAYIQEINEVEDQSRELHPDDTLPDACIVARDNGSTTPTLETVSAVGWYRRDHTRDTRTAVRDIVFQIR